VTQQKTTFYYMSLYSVQYTVRNGISTFIRDGVTHKSGVSQFLYKSDQKV